ncbi:MAG: hypothetical protein LC804_25665 [Acidobacteria bacterium]|nr:hypothetical protein [Acidobacteriota bacterium]
MVFNIEVVLRENDRAVASTVDHRGNEPALWTDEDVRAVLTAILRAIDRAKNPDGGARAIALRGFSWIVEPTGAQVVIALEIPTGAAVAGPFGIDQDRLDRMIARVVAAATAPVSRLVH